MKLWAGLLALGSPYSPSLPTQSDSGMPAAFVPDHSGGSATVLHRFPHVPFWDTHSLSQSILTQCSRGCQGNNARVIIAPRMIEIICYFLKSGRSDMFPFEFNKEPKVCEAGGVKFGGQPIITESSAAGFCENAGWLRLGLEAKVRGDSHDR